MTMHTLAKIVTPRKKRPGRGTSSGLGKTAGRGGKGQKKRENVMLGFEGGQLKLIKRLPYWRGHGKNKPRDVKPVEIAVEQLNKFSNKSIVDTASLVDHRIITQEQAMGQRIKIIGSSAITSNVTVKIPVSAGAKKSIEKAGGSVEK